LENVERSQQDDSAGRWRRRADHGVVVELADDRGPLLDLVVGEVVKGDEGAAFFQIGDQLSRKLAVVEVARVSSNALEGASQLGLFEDLIGLVVVAVALEDPLGVGKEGQAGMV